MWIDSNLNLLSSSRKEPIESNDTVAVSAISCFEVAWLARHQRINLLMGATDWFARALDDSGIVLCPITPVIAEIAVNLPEHHRDPQDRLIIATAIAHQANLISSDRKFLQYAELTGKLL